MPVQGELDVITDLVTFIEQQQFLAVEGIHRQPPSLEERTRARALRLAAARQQLAGAAGLLGRGLAALQVRGAWNLEGIVVGRPCWWLRFWHGRRWRGVGCVRVSALPLTCAAGQATVSDSGGGRPPPGRPYRSLRCCCIVSTPWPLAHATGASGGG